jgi:hypothetical protein
VDNIQIEPSKAFYALTDSSDYYYYPRSYNGQTENTSYPTEVKKFKGGDGRASVTSLYNDASMAILYRNPADNSKVYVRKVANANVYLYRASTIYLHLAEALNAMGYTDAAFAILKNGISTYLENLVKKPTLDAEGNIKIEPYKYMSQESVDMLVQLYLSSAPSIVRFSTQTMCMAFTLMALALITARRTSLHNRLKAHVLLPSVLR